MPGLTFSPASTGGRRLKRGSTGFGASMFARLDQVLSSAASMQRDKKSRGGMLRFIVLDEIGKPTVLQAPDESLLFAAYQEVGE